jgi:hypothetical protein
MRSIKQSIRTNQALEVIKNTHEGLSIVEACQVVGIARSTFYYFYNHHPDALAAYQEMRIVSILQQLALILGNQPKVLECVIKEGLADTTKPRDRLAILKQVTKMRDELLEDFRVNSRDGKDAADFLTGPTLKPAESRFSASESTINLP